MHGKLMLLLLLISIPIALSNAATVGSAYIYAPAVAVGANNGILTTIYLNISPGTGSVTISGPPTVGSSTLRSAETAVSYAASSLGINESRYNFSFVIHDKNASISGPSAGLAFTLLTISAFTGTPLPHNFTLTGTIQPNGSIGQIGGVIDKIGAASRAGLGFVIVPYAQNNSMEYMLYYIAQQEFHIPIAMAANVSQAEAFAFGTQRVTPLSYNTHTNYHTSLLPNATVSCVSCNTTDFSQLANFTFNFTENEINNLNPAFSTVKGQMLKSLASYKQIAAKGYLYAAADLSFLSFIDAYTIANSGLSISGASAVISNVSNYCSSITPPQVNNNNYELVVAGEVRQGWGESTVASAMSLLNPNSTSDDVVESMYAIAPAYGWCSAASDLYALASSINGTPVSMQGIKNTVTALVNSAPSYDNNVYTSSAVSAYKSGEYAAAYYDTIYASIFDNSTFYSNYTVAQLRNKTVANLNATMNGVWPAQFAVEAKFYLDEAAAMPQNSNLSNSYIDSAYATSVLADKISGANTNIESSFVPVNVTQIPGGVASQLSSIEKQVSEIYVLLFVLTALLFAIFIALIVLLLKTGRRTSAGVSRKRANRRR